MMELNASLRTPSPNKEFRRVSSRSAVNARTTSPTVDSAGSTVAADQIEASRIAKLPIGSGAGRFSPSQYLGRSNLSRTNIAVSLPASKLDDKGTRADGSVGDRLSKPLMLSQDEIKEARRERSMREFNAHLSTNSLDYIGLKPPPAGSPQKTPQSNAANAHGTSLFTEEAVELGESPPPPPTPMFSPLSTDELRLLKDSQDGLIASLGQHRPQGDQCSSPSAVSRAEEEARLRRFRRIQALQEDYRRSIRNTADLSGLNNSGPHRGNGSIAALDPARVLYPLEGKGSATVLAVRQTVARSVSQWLALHSAAAEALDEQISELSSLRGEHVALQQQLVASEHVLARTGEQNAELLRQLQQAVGDAERRVGPAVLDTVLESYPASWFLPQSTSIPALAATGGRSRSGSGDYSASAHLSRSLGLSRSGTPTRAHSQSGGITSRSELSQSRSSTPTAKSIRRYEMYGNDPHPDPEVPDGPEQDIRSRSGTPARAKVDPKMMPAGDAFSAPWSFQIDPEIRDKQVAATTVGHRFYGPPALQRRYGDLGQVVGTDHCGSTVVSAAGGAGSRSTSAGRSRSGTITSLGGYTFASDYHSSGLASNTGELSTLGSSGRAVRSTSASRMRAAHNEKTIQLRASPPAKHGMPRSRSTSPASGRVAGTLQRTQSEADHQRYQGGRLATAVRPARLGSARNKMDTLFSAEGQLYENGYDEPSQVNDQDGSYGSDDQHSQQQYDAAMGGQPTPLDNRTGYDSPEVVRPRGDSIGRPSVSAAQGPLAQPPAQSLRSPPPQDLAKILARTPSSSALSPRLKEEQQTALAGSPRPVDISQVRQPSRRRLSEATNSSDASYSGSRYSDIQWDSSGRIAHLGHHQPRTQPSAGPSSGSFRVSDGSSTMHRGGGPSTQQSLTAASSESDLQGVSLSGAVPWQAHESYSTAAADAEYRSAESGQGALITGNNNRDIAEIWNISSSSGSDTELESLYRAQGQGQRQSHRRGDGEGRQRQRLDSVPSDAVEAGSQGTTRTNRSIRNGGTGHYATPLHRHATGQGHSIGGGLRQSEGFQATLPAPWSGHRSGEIGNTGYVEETNSLVGHSYHADSNRSHQFGSATMQTTGLGSPIGVRPRSSSKVLTPSRRAVSTPKVRVPLASQAAVAPEAQIQALVARIAVRNEADEYIASLKKSLLK